MRTLFIFLSILETLHCFCPSGFELVSDGQCRGHYATMTMPYTTATDTAIARCKEVHGQPVSIHNDEQQSYWTEQATKNTNFIMLGLMCDVTSLKWKWADGSSLDYHPPDGSIDVNTNCTTGCAWYLPTSPPQGRWWQYCQSSTRPFEIFCTTQHTLPKTDGCARFEDDDEDAVCYQIGQTAETWSDAQLICRTLGANLASIHNPQENSFVRRLAISKGSVHGLYLGATISGKGGDFGWIDGSEWDFDNFYPGFPRVGFGECIVMDTSTSSGQWKNVDCNAQLPVACVRKKRAEAIVNETCSTETWKEGLIITSPGFPYRASVACDYYLMVDAGKKVEVEIVLLEANSCCDSLIIYDGYIGGYVLAVLTGEVHNATYTTTTSNIMMVTWQPNGGVNVYGFAMTFRGV